MYAGCVSLQPCNCHIAVFTLLSALSSLPVIVAATSDAFGILISVNDMPPSCGNTGEEGIATMKSTIRNRAAALAIAGAAGLTGIGLASGPAMAADAAQAGSSSQSSDAGVGTQSVYYPIEAGKYADELVIAWGQGNTDRVEAFASADVADTLAEHGDEDGTHWKNIGAEGAAGTTYLDYENTVTGEKMSLGVSNEAIADQNEWGAAPHAVHQVQFDD